MVTVSALGVGCFSRHPICFSILVVVVLLVVSVCTSVV